MDMSAAWLLLVIIVMLTGICIWLDHRVQKLEDTVWDLLIEKTREGLYDG